jgi:DNA-binding NtrC family response regulator
MSNGNILVVDDNIDNRELMALMLRKGGYSVVVVESARAALERCASEEFDLLLIDLQMPEMDGMTLLQELRRTEPNTPAIVVTAYASVERAVEAMKAGATDFLTKPLTSKVLLAQVRKSIDVAQLMTENRRLREEVGGKYDFSKLVARSTQMQKVVHLAAEAAEREVTVLITGESGVGKEVVGRAIHYNSKRSRGPFFALNCAAITETLMESELFGHEKGAFTGAYQRKAGLIEQAAAGTLLLDEIADMPLSAQAKLLRVIENREMIPVGGTRTIQVRARIIAATNKNLLDHVRQKSFREDLFHRLNVFAIEIPPLRERRGDILPLAKEVLGRLARETGKDLPGLSRDAVERLMTAQWRGNVRELANAIERAVIISRGNLITSADFPEDQPGLEVERRQGAGSSESLVKLEDAERDLLLRALERADNNLSKAARLLGMGRGAFRYRLEKHRIVPKAARE